MREESNNQRMSGIAALRETREGKRVGNHKARDVGSHPVLDNSLLLKLRLASLEPLELPFTDVRGD